MKPHPSEYRIKCALQEANAAFWERIRSHYPEARREPQSPVLEAAFDDVQRRMVRNWLLLNVDENTAGIWPAHPALTQLMIDELCAAAEKERLEKNKADKDSRTGLWGYVAAALSVGGLMLWLLWKFTP